MTVIEQGPGLTGAAEAVSWSAEKPQVEVPDFGDPLESLISAWVERAIGHAHFHHEDPHEIIVDVAGLDGVWAEGDTRDHALDELRSVLTDWVRFKLEDGDDDIPPMEGIVLVITK